ncbi:hypothetical protein HNR43_000295 [Anoxybacillus mongoliensis]|uniref:DUF2777 domain-containing protein n=1 Tax=Anoxybacillus mongoliensis TaxID=452565 RepID=A0A7W8JCT4_9BACL|nr:DUF2777 family protein [Anoxybacillus mongoliensis]MBB5354340.1 hypothetical protein [Anoxybacillus mongoliensis]
MDRLSSLRAQKRAYIYGVVEQVNGEWVFFDEDDEAHEMINLPEEVELFRFGQWVKGWLGEHGDIYMSERYTLKNGDRLRYMKPLSHAYEQWLAQLPDHAFFHFIHLINEWNFSVYDCLYCYNYMLFAEKGVNFLMFDNSLDMCNVQHYFDGKQHRFELTLQTGKKMIGVQLDH